MPRPPAMKPGKRAAKRAGSTRDRSTSWQEQRKQLLHAAQRVIRRLGPDVSMDEMAREAGITKPILYRHFGDRKGLACALRDSVLGLMVGAESSDPKKGRRAARERVAAFYPVVDEPEALLRVVASFAAGFSMFVELNRDVYRFLKAEGVMDRMWEEPEGDWREPVAESLAGSLKNILRERGIDEEAARIWGVGLRGMVASVVDWWVDSRACDRFELERYLVQLARAAITGLIRSTPASRVEAAANRAARSGERRKPRSARGTARPRPRRR